jgi:hypothetical protein
MDCKNNLIEVLEEMIKSYEGQPPHAMCLPANQYDIMMVLMMFKTLVLEIHAASDTDKARISGKVDESLSNAPLDNGVVAIH